MRRIQAVQGDITQLAVEAVVNAANRTLLGGGGVDGAIHRAAGPELLKECRMLDGCDTGDAKLTRGYQLAATFVIHAVGPVWSGGKRGEPELLESCYRRSLEIAVEHKIRSIAFPCISTGVYRFPKDMAVRIAVKTVQSFLESHSGDFEKIVFCCFSSDDYKRYSLFIDV